MIAGRIFVAAAAALIGCSCSTPSRQPTGEDGEEPRPRQFEAEIARIERDDPASPAVLSARLTFIEFLLDESSGACAPRLEHARAELRAVTSNPESRAMFPDGWARPVDLEYRLRLARAACGPAKARDF